MKSVVSVLTGLIAGWLLTESHDLMPDSFTSWVGNAVAGSGAIRAVLELLPLSSGAANTVHIWIIVASISFIPVFGISLFAAAVHLWSRKARLIVYGSLIVPLFMTALAISHQYRLAQVDPRLAMSWWSNAGGNVQSYILNVCLFALAFFTIKQGIKRAETAETHNQ